MTTSTRLAGDVIPSAEPEGRHAADSIEDRRVRWRLAMESAWERKIDEVVTLSKASLGPTSCSDGSPVNRDVPVSSRLEARIERAFDELADIEAAIASVDDST